MRERAPAILWFRRDLRLADNPALHRAIESGRPIIPLYILDEEAGAASRWWLHMSLARLGEDLTALGGGLILRRGNPAQILGELARQQGARAVYYNRLYEPGALKVEAEISAKLKAAGVEAMNFAGALLSDPCEIVTGAGKPYSVFTPYWKKWRTAVNPSPPLPRPARIARISPPQGDRLEDWRLRPQQPDWAQSFTPYWQPGEKGAAELLDRFAADGIRDYEKARDLPAVSGTSRLSPHLHFGEISPGQVWHRLQHQLVRGGHIESGATAYLRQLCWRDFCHSLLYHNPGLPQQNLKSEFDAFPWRQDAKGLKAWKQGRTGYPIVDAGMRQLWQTGWMHNRVRMIAASFLIKDLLIDWREGEKWFWDTLVDADLANNSVGWQWVAGSGADASPFFRIFNPTLQGRKFDPEGDYIRRWIPELANLPAKYIHCPWQAPAHMLTGAAKTYPQPILDHALARNRALAAYKSIR